MWKQLAFGDLAGRNEAWLRDLLQKHPKLVPLDDLDPTYGPLVPLCTELSTPAGRIDNVFISPQGRLTLVECKLWNNVESRRKVVAQILDYAKELVRWSATDLEARVASRRGPGSPNLIAVVNAALKEAKQPPVSESDFNDGLVRSLREGRFQLLIAGDGIREEVRGIADLINRNATSAFSFGLVQVELYEGPGGALLVQPRGIARTQLIERTVILVQEPDRVRLESVDTPDAGGVESRNMAGTPRAQSDSAAWWKPVLEAGLQNKDQEPFHVYLNNIRTPLPWQGTWITAYRSSTGPQPTIGVFVGGREHPRAELLRALESEWEELQVVLPEKTTYVSGQRLEVVRTLSEFSDDDAARKWLIETINRFINELRPRVAALARP